MYISAGRAEESASLGPLEIHPDHYVCFLRCCLSVHRSVRLGLWAPQPGPEPSSLWPGAEQGEAVVNGRHQGDSVTWHLFPAPLLYN